VAQRLFPHRNRARTVTRTVIGMRKRTEAGRAVQAFALELGIYAVFVAIYFFTVLHFLGDWLVALEHRNIRVYAVVAILLVVGQAVLLEAVTTGLMKLLRGGRSE
jgi:hypothetical protein